MSKYEDPTQLDYRYGGDTVDDFAQKYMKTVAYIFSALNELRSPTGGTLTQNPEAYQLKVDDNKLYIRNQANTDWILLGDVQENFGFRTSAADAFMHESDVADSGTAGKLIRADASGKLNADILGNAAKIADKAIQMGLDLADEDRLVYDKDTDTITNRPLQFRVDGDKIYARKDATTGWVLLGDLKQNLGFRDSTDDAFLTEADVADSGTAGKLIRADVNGKLNADILGNARKMAGKTFAPEALQDGQIPVYRASDGTWHAENKGTVGAGKNLMIMDGDKMLGEYNGDEMKAIDIQKSSLTKALAESTGYGIVSGCAPTISGLTVTVGAGIVHLADGKRKEIVQMNITLDNADPINPRIDLVYINADGEVAKVTGTAAASPSAPAVPTGGISVCNVTIAAGASTGTVNRVQTIAPNLANYDIVNVKDFGAKGDGVADDTEAIQAAINSLPMSYFILYFPPGRYRMSQGFTLTNKDHFEIEASNTYLRAENGDTVTFVGIKFADVNLCYITSITGNGITIIGQDGINLYNQYLNIRFKELNVAGRGINAVNEQGSWINEVNVYGGMWMRGTCGCYIYQKSTNTGISGWNFIRVGTEGTDIGFEFEAEAVDDMHANFVGFRFYNCRTYEATVIMKSSAACKEFMFIGDNKEFERNYNWFDVTYRFKMTCIGADKILKFGYNQAKNKYTVYPVYFYPLNRGRELAANEDLNDVTDLGRYHVDSNARTLTIKHRPNDVTVVFMMIVEAYYGTGDNDNQINRLQRITTRNALYHRRIYSNDGGKTWVTENWYKVAATETGYAT